MNSAFMHFSYLGKILMEFNAHGGLDIYECHECFAIVRQGKVPEHYDSHGIA